MPGSPRFKIVVPSYNCASWLGRCLSSIERQTYRHFDVCVVDDASTDPGQRTLIEGFCQRNGWRSILNAENRGALPNILDGIRALAPRDADVLTILDGDDWFFNARVLSKLRRYYTSDGPFVTWGRYVAHPEGWIGCKPVSRDVVQARSYRQVPWEFSHLRTFRHFLWRQIRDEDLRDEAGEYFRVAWDLAIMYPMLEMAGSQIKFINEILVTHNRANPLNDDKVHGREHQVAAERLIKSRPAYPRLLHGACRNDSTNFWNQLKIKLLRVRHRLRASC